jgi:hypothetical protein
VPARGSLGEVLPLSLLDRFAAASDGSEWRASSGRPSIPGVLFRLRGCVGATHDGR